MACFRWIGLSVLVALFALPSSSARASHCDGCNHGLPTEVTIKTTELGPEGVVVIRLDDPRERILDQRSWDITSVTVSDASGAPVDGDLELHPGFAVAAWRPATEWLPGTYELLVEVDLPSFDGDDDHCLAYSHTESIVVTEQPQHVVGERTLDVTEAYRLDPRQSLTTLVCCDGALPYRASVPGILCPGYPDTELQTGGGYCTPLEGTGRLRVDAELRLDGEAAPADYTLREVTRDRTSASGAGRVAMDLAAPDCLEFEALDLVTGELTLHSSCHGEELADMLGSRELDPAPGLAASCDDVAYVCEVDGDAWDPTACTTWPGGEPYLHPASPSPAEDDEPTAEPGDGAAESGSGGCTLGERTPGHPLAPLALLLLAGRRGRPPSAA